MRQRIVLSRTGPDGRRRLPVPALPPRVAKLLRYATVSGISTVTGLTVLAVLVTAGMSAGWANVVATAVGTIPSFELNRRWVWSLDTRRSLTRQMAPFVLWCFFELLGSTLVVQLAADWAGGHHVTGVERTAILELAHVVAFGSFWVGQYILLDKVLFRHGRARTSGPAGPASGEVDGPGTVEGESRQAGSGARA
jgi:putative flippase GtrA